MRYISSAPFRFTDLGLDDIVITNLEKEKETVKQNKKEQKKES